MILFKSVNLIALALAASSTCENEGKAHQMLTSPGSIAMLRSTSLEVAPSRQSHSESTIDPVVASNPTLSSSSQNDFITNPDPLAQGGNTTGPPVQGKAIKLLY